MQRKFAVKVLFIITVFDRLGGAEKNLYDIVSNIDQSKYKPYVLALKGGELACKMVEKGFDVQVNGLRKILSKEALINGKNLYSFLKRERINVVVTYHHDADIWGGIVSRLAGVPVISNRRDMGYQLEVKHVWFYRLMNKFFTRFITVSDAVKNQIVEREWINCSRITTIHNGLRLESFNTVRANKSLAEALGLKPGKVVIGMVASFRPIKGQEYLVEAVAKITEHFSDIQVVVVGYNDTEYFQRVFGRVKELGLLEHFVFTGSRSDVPDLLALFDIFVISSIHEGFSNAIIEAMAAGKPVIAPNSGGNPEAVQHGETGLLFTPCDSLSLAENLLRLLRSPDLRMTMGEKGTQAVEEKFLLEQMVHKYEELLREVADYG